MNGSIKAGDSIDLLARIVLPDGSYPVPADVASVTLLVHNTTTDQQVLVSELAAGQVMTAAPVLDVTRWHEDDTGFNVAITLAAETFAGPANYTADITITRTDSTTITARWTIQVSP